MQGDAPRLRQVLLNLLGNSVKFTLRGEVRLVIAAQGASRIRFTVSDTGQGIAPEEQERVFQAFYQTAYGISKGEGTGLGLAISREYVRLMGGELMLEGAEGEGSRFSFTIDLPAVLESEVRAPIRRIKGLAPGQNEWRVLVVEDQPDNRALLCRLMEVVGFEVRAAEDGQQAVQAFQDWHPDFIWMDMRMPVMDGYEAARRIRALPEGATVRIAALTASAFKEDEAAILAAGCNAVVAKPLQESWLFEAMQQLLGVEFEYEADADTHPGVGEPTGLDALPEALVEELAVAAEGLDIEEARAIVEMIRTHDAAAADYLAALLRDFRFDAISRLCER